MASSAWLVTKLGSGALSGKMLLENNKVDDYPGQVWRSKGLLCPAGLGKGLSPQGLEIGKKAQIIFNNPRSSIKP